MQVINVNVHKCLPVLCIELVNMCNYKYFEFVWFTRLSVPFVTDLLKI